MDLHKRVNIMPLGKKNAALRALRTPSLVFLAAPVRMRSGTQPSLITHTHTHTGSGALAGNPFDIDRDAMAADMKFSGISGNSLDATAGRDFVAEFLFDATMIMLHLSKWAEDLCNYNSKEFGFVGMSDAYRYNGVIRRSGAALYMRALFFMHCPLFTSALVAGIQHGELPHAAEEESGLARAHPRQGGHGVWQLRRLSRHA
jgi:hypothetical protein